MRHLLEFNDMVEKSIELSRAISDLGVLTVIAGIFLVLVIIMFGFFIHQLLNQQKALATISKASELTVEYFKQKVKSEINLDQARSIISRSYARLSTNCVIKIVKLKQDPSNQNTEVAKLEINSYVENLIRDHKSYLQKFSFNGTSLMSLYEESLASELQQKMLLDSKPSNKIDTYKIEEDYSELFQKYSHILEGKISDLTNI